MRTERVQQMMRTKRDLLSTYTDHKQNVMILY